MEEEEPMQSGELKILLECGRNLTDKDLFGKQDPYCLMTCGQRTQRSEVAKNGGRNPDWYQLLRFNISYEREIKIVVMDKDLIIDDLIGTGTVSIMDARLHGRVREKVPLFKKGKPQGFIQLELMFTADTSELWQATAAA